MPEWLETGLAGIGKLPEQQRSVLMLLAQGCDNQEIADALSLQCDSAETMIKRVYRRLGLSGNQNGIKRVRACVIFRAARERGVLH